jgi:hypothetical protein
MLAAAKNLCFPMLRLVLVFSSICILKECDCQKISLLDYKTYFNKDLKNWTISFRNFQLSAFNVSNTSNFGSSYDFSTATPYWKEFYALYKPALTFSSDSSKFVDIYSYELNLEKKGKKIVSFESGEQTAEFYDLTKRKTCRILFCGISSQLQEIIWVGNSKFILVGREIEEDNKVYPLIYLADTKKRKLISFRTNDNTCIEKSNAYSSPKSKKLTYQED